MVKVIARAFRWREMLENGKHATIAIRLTEPDSTPIFSTARTLWPAGFTDVDFGLGVSLADEAAARSRVSQLSP